MLLLFTVVKTDYKGCPTTILPPPLNFKSKAAWSFKNKKKVCLKHFCNQRSNPKWRPKTFLDLNKNNSCYQ